MLAADVALLAGSAAVTITPTLTSAEAVVAEVEACGFEASLAATASCTPAGPQLAGGAGPCHQLLRLGGCQHGAAPPCGPCSAAVKKALAALEGVTSVGGIHPQSGEAEVGWCVLAVWRSAAAGCLLCCASCPLVLLACGIPVLFSSH